MVARARRLALLGIERAAQWAGSRRPTLRAALTETMSVLAGPGDWAALTARAYDRNPVFRDLETFHDGHQCQRHEDKA